MATPPLLRKMGRAERARHPHNISHQIDQLRSKVDEIIQALANLNTNVTGSSTGTAPMVGHAAWTGSYSTASADGILDTYLRSDTILKFPPALGTPTRIVTLTNDGTEGALLTADNSFAANLISLKAPNATNTLRVGKYGNISIAGTAALDTQMMIFSKSDFNEAALVQGLAFTMGNTGIGTGGVPVRGISATVSASGVNAGGTFNGAIEAIRVAVSAGASGNNNFIGSIIAIRNISNTVTEQTIGTAVTAVTDFQSSNTNAFTRAAITERLGFEHNGAITLLTSATLTNHYGFRCNALTGGTNRVGYRCLGVTTGTPTISYGFQSLSHSVGTTRRSFIGDNTFENTTTDFLCSTTAKGLICKDSQGTAEYWRTYIDSTGTKDMTMTVDSTGFASFTRAASATGDVLLKVIDTGTAAPTT